MPVKIKNLTKGPVLLRYNSGQTLYLGPGDTTPEILETDVSTKIRRLETRRVIAVHPVERKKPSSEQKQNSQSKATEK